MQIGMALRRKQMSWHLRIRKKSSWMAKINRKLTAAPMMMCRYKRNLKSKRHLRNFRVPQLQRVLLLLTSSSTSRCLLKLLRLVSKWISMESSLRWRASISVPKLLKSLGIAVPLLPNAKLLQRPIKPSLIQDLSQIVWLELRVTRCMVCAFKLLSETRLGAYFLINF